MCWCWNWFRYRWFNVRLQKLISVVPLSKALISAAFLFYWREGSETGEFPINWQRADYVLSVVDLGCFFGSLLMVAKGWMITRGALHKFEVRRVSAMIFLLMVSKALYVWVNGFVLFFPGNHVRSNASLHIFFHRRKYNESFESDCYLTYYPNFKYYQNTCMDQTKNVQKISGCNGSLYQCGCYISLVGNDFSFCNTLGRGRYGAFHLRPYGSMCWLHICYETI